MPTYEYRCKDCGRDLEVVQSFTDDALTTCEACGGSLRKVFGNVGIAFKGSGFYKNDSRGKSSSSTTGGDKADKASGDKSDKSDKSTADTGTSTKTDSGTTKTDSGSAPAKKDAPAAAKSSSTSS